MSLSLTRENNSSHRVRTPRAIIRRSLRSLIIVYQGELAPAQAISRASKSQLKDQSLLATDNGVWQKLEGGMAEGASHFRGSLRRLSI